MSQLSSDSQTSEKSRSMRTALYDCSLDLKIEAPRHELTDVDQLQTITLSAITCEFVIKHEEYRPVIGLIYSILKGTLGASEANWRVFKKNRLLLKRSEENAGHIGRTLPLKASPILHTIVYSGEVSGDGDGHGPIHVDCSLKLFLSPGIYGAKDFYEDHDFPIEHHKESRCENVDGLMEAFRELEKQKEEVDLSDTWRIVAEAYEAPRSYWVPGRFSYEEEFENSEEHVWGRDWGDEEDEEDPYAYAGDPYWGETDPEDEEDSDGRESDAGEDEEEEDDLDVEGLMRPRRKRRRLDEDCCIV